MGHLCFEFAYSLSNWVKSPKLRLASMAFCFDQKFSLCKVISRVNSENFQNFRLNCYFWWKIKKNDNMGEFPNFREFILNMTLPIFLKIAIPIMVFFVENIKIHIYGEFVKIQEFTLIIIFAISPSKMTIWAWKWNFEISRNSLYPLNI